MNIEKLLLFSLIVVIFWTGIWEINIAFANFSDDFEAYEVDSLLSDTADWECSGSSVWRITDQDFNTGTRSVGRIENTGHSRHCWRNFEVTKSGVFKLSIKRPSTFGFEGPAFELRTGPGTSGDFVANFAYSNDRTISCNAPGFSFTCGTWTPNEWQEHGIAWNSVNNKIRWFMNGEWTEFKSSDIPAPASATISCCTSGHEGVFLDDIKFTPGIKNLEITEPPSTEISESPSNFVIQFDTDATNWNGKVDVQVRELTDPFRDTGMLSGYQSFTFSSAGTKTVAFTNPLNFLPSGRYKLTVRVFASVPGGDFLELDNISRIFRLPSGFFTDLDEDFEAYEVGQQLGKQDNWECNESIETHRWFVNDENVFSGARAIRKMGAHDAICRRNFDNVSNGQIFFAANHAQADPFSRLAFSVRNAAGNINDQFGGSEDRIGLINLRGDGTVECHTIESSSVCGTHNIGEWAQYGIEWDGILGRVRFNVNGEWTDWFDSNNARDGAEFYFLAAGAGSGNTQVMFIDDIRFAFVTPEPEQLNPVIIVPGLLGSWQKDGEWIIDPIFRKYDELIRLLDVSGYTPDVDLFTFPYDWQQGVSLSSDQLAAKIVEIRSICQCQKVDIIAHSMGGLVARSYAQSGDYQNDIDQIIFLGTSHEGLSWAYLLWEGGEITPQIFSLGFDKIMELYLNWKSIISFAGSKFAYIQNAILSIKDLLPTYDYLKDADTEILRNYPDNYPVNFFLELLNSSLSENRLSERGIRITNIVGNIEPNFIDGKLVDETLGTIRVVDRPNLLPKWEHGFPENFDVPFTDHGLEFDEGDRRVTLESASHNFSSTVISRADRNLHANLPVVAWQQIHEALFGIPSPERGVPIVIEESLIIPIFSPADIQIIDPLGRRIGKDFSIGQEINEIPFAFYSGFNSDLEFIFIPNPLDGEYQIKVQGTDEGSYEVQSAFVNDATSTVATFMANIQESLVQNLSFVFNVSSPELTTIQPEDTTPPIITSTQIPSEVLLNSPPLTFNFSAQDDLTGVFSISATLNDQSITNGSAINFDIPGTYFIEIVAEDFVGNVATETIIFDVIYEFGGFLPPVKADGSGIYKLGRTLPVKFQLADVSGQFISTATATLTLAKVQDESIGNEETPLSTSAADTDNIFRYDSENNQYIYNLSTDMMSVGTWQLRINLDDDRHYTVFISIK